MTALTNFTLYISADGNSVKIENFTDDGDTLPEQAKALTCKTHQDVLDFLEELKNSDTKERLNFYHYNNYSYSKHEGFSKGNAHPCSLENQMEFIRFKISESVQGVKHPAPRAYSYCILL